MTTQENNSQSSKNDKQISSSEKTSVNSSPEWIVEKTDKDVILEDLKKTMHDMGRIPRMLMAPVITYIASKRETIPEERRSHLQKIVHDIKDSWGDGRSKLKERFGGKHDDTEKPADSTASAASEAPAVSANSSAAKSPAKTPTKSTTAEKVSPKISPAKHTATKPSAAPKAEKTAKPAADKKSAAAPAKAKTAPAKTIAKQSSATAVKAKPSKPAPTASKKTSTPIKKTSKK